MIALDTLMGADDSIGFEDILGGMYFYSQQWLYILFAKIYIIMTFV